MKKALTDLNQLLEHHLNPPEGVATGVAMDLMFALEARRAEQGLSYAELARRMGVSRQHVHKLMSGTQNSTIGSLVKLALALGCELQITLKPLPGNEAGDQPAGDAEAVPVTRPDGGH